MKIGASYSLGKLQLGDLVAAKRIGFDFVEFYMDKHLIDSEELKLQLIAIREIIDSYDLFTIIHLPHLNSQILNDTDLWTDYIDRMTEYIQLIGELGIATKIVFHGVFGHTEDPPEMTKDEVDKAKDAAIKEWLTIAKKYGIKLLLENTDESVDDLKAALKRHKDLGFTFDIGHANILFTGSIHQDSEEKIYSIFNTLKKRVEHIHLNDNLGGFSENADIHLPIGTGIIDFPKFFAKLQEIKYSETITLEIYNPDFHSIYLEASLKTIQEIIRNKKDSF